MRVIGDGLSKKARSGSVDDIRQRNDEKREVVNNSGLDSAFKRIDPTWALDVKPTLNFDFTRNEHSVYDGQDFVKGQLVDHADFQRNSEATYIDATGVLRTAAVDEPRFTYDPETGEALGLLIEEQRTNLLLWSEAFDNAVWSKARVTVTSDDSTAPDGVQTADKLVESTDTNSHLIFQNVTYTEGQRYTHTVFVKAAESSFASLMFPGTEGFDVNSGITVDLETGEITTEYGALLARETEVLNNGWVRLSITKAASRTGAGRSAYVAVVQNGLQKAQDVYTGDGTSGIYIWGAQLEQGSFPTSYIKTEGSQVTREADNCSRALGAEFNAREGTLVFSVVNISTGQLGQRVYWMGDSSQSEDTNSFSLVSLGGDNYRFDVNSNGVKSRTYLTAPTLSSAGAEVKVALAYSAAKQFLYVDGVKRAESSAALPVGVDWLELLSRSFPVKSGNIKYINYTPRALSAAELEALTAPD